jgi:hypothetical protein
MVAADDDDNDDGDYDDHNNFSCHYDGLRMLCLVMKWDAKSQLKCPAFVALSTAIHPLSSVDIADAVL